MQQDKLDHKCSSSSVSRRVDEWLWRQVLNNQQSSTVITWHTLLGTWDEHTHSPSSQLLREDHLHQRHVMRVLTYLNIVLSCSHSVTRAGHQGTSWQHRHSLFNKIFQNVTRVSLTSILATTNHSSTHHGLINLMCLILVIISVWWRTIQWRNKNQYLHAFFIGQHSHINLLKKVSEVTIGSICSPAWHSGSDSSVGLRFICWQTHWSDQRMESIVNILLQLQHGEVILHLSFLVILRVRINPANIHPHITLCDVPSMMFTKNNLTTN